MDENLNPQSKAWGAWVVIAGLVVVLVVALFAISRWTDTKDVTAVIGSVTGVVGTLAGAYFGVHAGQAGRDRAEAQKDDAQQKLTRLAAAVDPNVAARVMNLN